MERVSGESVDISEYLDNGFYVWVWYRDNAGLGVTKLERWLGVSHRIGTIMSFWVLTSTGKILSRTTVQRVTNLELQVDENKAQFIAFTTAIDQHIGGNDLAPHDENGELVIDDDWRDPEFDPMFMEEFGTTINDPKLKEADKDLILTCTMIRT